MEPIPMYIDPDFIYDVAEYFNTKLCSEYLQKKIDSRAKWHRKQTGYGKALRELRQLSGMVEEALEKRDFEKAYYYMMQKKKAAAPIREANQRIKDDEKINKWKELRDEAKLAMEYIEKTKILPVLEINGLLIKMRQPNKDTVDAAKTFFGEKSKKGRKKNGNRQ